MEDWKIYNAINEVDTIPPQGLDIEKDKQVSVGQITKDQKKQLQQLLSNNNDLFA